MICDYLSDQGLGEICSENLSTTISPASSCVIDSGFPVFFVGARAYLIHIYTSSPGWVAATKAGAQNVMRWHRKS